MKVSDYIVSFLAEHGVKVVFGYIGGMITHLVDSLGQSDQVRYIQTYHEQTAAIAAEGYAIESGKFGVAICTSGPGVTNMLTGIADAYMGSIPVIYISGQVNTYEYKYDKPIRQQGFQEMDVISVVRPITKYAVLLDDAKRVRYELEKAVYVATHGRKGPVVIDLPMDISRADIDVSKQIGYQPEKCEQGTLDLDFIRPILEGAQRPMVLIGGGCQDSNARKKIDSFLQQTEIPVVTSLMGRGLIDESYPYYVGMIGSYGNRCANMAISRSDVLIALGTRLDTRQTGAQYQSFLPKGKVIHVDIDNNELECNRLENQISICADVARFVDSLIESHILFRRHDRWNDWISLVKNRYCQESEVLRFVENKTPYRIIQYLNTITLENDIIAVDTGQNQMWAAQSLKMKIGQRFVTSGGLAPMGFALAVSVGMSFANPDKRIFCVTGDGGLHMAVQSLGVISQYGLNIKIILMDNASLGMITQFQHLYYNDRMYGTTRTGGYENPDFSLLARAYGIDYLEKKDGDMDFDSKSRGPLFVHYVISGLTKVSPKLEYNQPIDKPSPSLPTDEYSEIMGLIE